MNAQPAKSKPVCDEREDYEDVWPPCTKIRECTENEEQDALDSERNAVAEQDNAVDCSIAPKEWKDTFVARSFVE